MVAMYVQVSANCTIIEDNDLKLKVYDNPDSTVSIVRENLNTGKGAWLILPKRIVPALIEALQKC